MVVLMLVPYPTMQQHCTTVAPGTWCECGAVCRHQYFEEVEKVAQRCVGFEKLYLRTVARALVTY